MSCRIVVVVAQPLSDVMSVLWSGLLRQDGVCLARVHDLHQCVQGATVHADGDRECHGIPRVALQLSLFDAATAPPDLMHRQEAVRSLVDVHDTVHSVLVHGPAELDEQPVRAGVLLPMAVELFFFATVISKLLRPREQEVSRVTAFHKDISHVGYRLQNRSLLHCNNTLL